MDKEFVSDRRRRNMMVMVVMIIKEKVNPAATLPSALEGNNIARKYFMAFDVDNNKMASVSNIENSVFRV